MDCSKRFDVLRKISKKIPLDSTNALDEENTLIEIQTAIRKLKTNTSPGPDGLSSELYQRHDMLFAQLLQPVFAEDWEGGKLPKSFSNATIKLLPRKEGLKEAKDFRPISLRNADQKILANICKKVEDCPTLCDRWRTEGLYKRAINT